MLLLPSSGWWLAHVLSTVAHAHAVARYSSFARTPIGCLVILASWTWSTLPRQHRTHISLSFDKIPRHPPQVIMPLTALTTAPRLCDPAFQSFAVVDEWADHSTTAHWYRIHGDPTTTGSSSGAGTRSPRPTTSSDKLVTCQCCSPCMYSLLLASLFGPCDLGDVSWVPSQSIIRYFECQWRPGGMYCRARSDTTPPQAGPHECLTAKKAKRKRKMNESNT